MIITYTYPMISVEDLKQKHNFKETNSMPMVWWYWLASASLLTIGVMGWSIGFALAIALTSIQVGHFFAREGSIKAFPVQLRIAYLAILLVAAIEPLNWLYYIPAVGTWLVVATGYCLLARGLTLMPWNRKEPLTVNLVWETFTVRATRKDEYSGKVFRITDCNACSNSYCS